MKEISNCPYCNSETSIIRSMYNISIYCNKNTCLYRLDYERSTMIATICFREECYYISKLISFILNQTRRAKPDQFYVSRLYHSTCPMYLNESIDDCINYVNSIIKNIDLE